MVSEHAAPHGETGTPTRLEILRSAAIAFRRFGYHGATVEHIAATLGMKKGNLYYYYQNKEEILFACHQYSLDRLLLQSKSIDRDASPDERLRRLIISSVHTILDELQGTALFLDLEALTPEHREIVVARRDEFDRGLRQVITDGVRTGIFAEADTKLLSFAILGAVNWIPRWYSSKGPLSTQEIAESFADYLIAGLRRPAATIE